MANGHGGARPGAGRPRKAEKYAGQIAAAEDLIADKLPWLVAKAMELAEGVQAVRHTQKGEVVYEKPPCFHSIKMLLERIIGTVTHQVELTGEEGGPLKIVVEYEDAPGPPQDPPAACGPAVDPG